MIANLCLRVWLRLHASQFISHLVNGYVQSNWFSIWSNFDAVFVFRMNDLLCMLPLCVHIIFFWAYLPFLFPSLQFILINVLWLVLPIESQIIWRIQILKRASNETQKNGFRFGICVWRTWMVASHIKRFIAKLVICQEFVDSNQAEIVIAR